MQNSMKAMRRQHIEEKKASKQLKEAVRNLKEELHLLNKSIEKAALECSQKRC